MNPRTAMDCIACAVMPTAVWLIPVAVQNRITCSCAVSFVVAFAMAYSLHRPARYAAGGGGGGFGGLGGGGFGGFGGSMGAAHSTHSITSSARASSVGGTVRPSILAV